MRLPDTGGRFPHTKQAPPPRTAKFTQGHGGKKTVHAMDGPIIGIYGSDGKRRRPQPSREFVGQTIAGGCSNVARCVFGGVICTVTLARTCSAADERASVADVGRGYVAHVRLQTATQACRRRSPRKRWRRRRSVARQPQSAPGPCFRWRPAFALDRMLPTAIRRAVICSREEEKAPEAVLRPHPTG